jgi:hypothetical protein
VHQPNWVVRQKSVVVRQKRNGVWDKKFIKKSLDRVERKWGGTQHQITVTNQLVTYYNEPKQTLRGQKSDSFHTIPIPHPLYHQRYKKQRKFNAKPAQKTAASTQQYRSSSPYPSLFNHILGITLQQKPLIIHGIPRSPIQRIHSSIMSRH